MTKCSNPIFHQEKCLEAKQRLIKTVRLRLPSVAHLIPTLDLKIIVLHRDPRGVMNSRWSKTVGGWCCKYLFQKDFLCVLIQCGGEPTKFGLIYLENMTSEKTTRLLSGET